VVPLVKPSLLLFFVQLQTRRAIAYRDLKEAIVERGETQGVNMSITAEEVLAEIGPVQEILDEHDGVVTVLDTSDGNIMLSLDGGCNGCSSTPMTAMQIYYSLKKLEAINDVIFVNGELPEYMRTFIDQKMAKEQLQNSTSDEDKDEGGPQPQGEIV
jgi:Fe-S cluster biogenesis protein NfuA